MLFLPAPLLSGYGKYGYGKEKERRNSDRTAREQGGKA
jgi:hypothetical protein